MTRQTADNVATRIDFVDLRLAVNVAEARSLTRGAELSAMSLAAASMRVKRVEDTFGITVFHRGRNGIVPTAAGESFLRHARALLQQLDRMRIELAAHAQGARGRLRLLANTTSKASLLPRLLPAFLGRYPDVDIEFREAGSRAIVKALFDGLADVGIVSGHVSTDGLETWPYLVDRMVLVTSLRHPLAARPSVRFAETLGYDFIGGHPDSALHAFVLESAQACGQQFKQRIQVGTHEEMCQLIEQDIGIGVLPSIVVERCGHRVKAIDIEDAWSVQPLKVCALDPEHLPDYGRGLIEFLVAHAETGGLRSG